MSSLRKRRNHLPKQEEEVLIAQLEPLQSQDLAINPESSIPQNPNPPRNHQYPRIKIPKGKRKSTF
jgi:hypothetical protein